MDKLEKMCRDHFNEPVVVGNEIARCIGYAEDDRDCYIIIKDSDGHVYWHDGGYVWLDRLRGQDLTRIDNNLSFRCPKEEEFIYIEER